MKPDWESADGAIRLWCNDCLSVLPTLEPGSVSAVVTDPPYERLKGGTQIKGNGGVAGRRLETRTVGTELGTSEGLLHAKRIARCGAISFCSYHWIERCVELLGGSRRGLLSWYKPNSPYSTNNSPWFVTEYAWLIQYAPGIDWRALRTHIEFPMLQAGCMAVERIVNDGAAVHPTQKPVSLMSRLLLSGMDSVCDPYMGLGTTGVACIRTGRRFLGIEIDPTYFDIAVRRIEAELNRTPLFDPPPIVQKRIDLEPSDD